jgi:hypothetical protein
LQFLFPLRPDGSYSNNDDDDNNNNKNNNNNNIIIRTIIINNNNNNNNDNNNNNNNRMQKQVRTYPEWSPKKSSTYRKVKQYINTNRYAQAFFEKDRKSSVR